MAETYCGKSCTECTQKETLACPGCRVGPGRQLGGPCNLARCVRTKGHETCASCAFKGNCGTLRGRDGMPDYWRRKREAEDRRLAAIARKAPIFGKWIWVLFWLIIPSAVGALLTNQTVVAALPALNMPGQILKAAVCGVYGSILLKLSQEEDRYRTAGICYLITGGVGLVLALVTGTEEPVWTLLFTIPALVVSLIGEYSEYAGHSVALTGVDDDLSDRWERLWKWYITLNAIVIGSILVLFILPVLGALAMLAASIGLIVISIKKLIYLYRMAKVFREYTPGA